MTTAFKNLTMIRFNHISILFLSILVAGCTSDLKDEKISASVETADTHTEEYVPGTANVYFTEEVAEMLESSDDDVFESLGVTSCTRLFPDEGRFEERKRKEGLHRWYRITYDENSAVTKSSDGIHDLPGVEIFSKERRIALNSFFNDPRLERQWNYYNSVTNMQGFVPGSDINVLPVWDNFTTGNSSVIVAVVDEGVDFTHEDLAANYVGGKNFGTGGKVTPDEHGTHVAGTIAAVNNNGIGVSGIAGGDAEAGINGVGILSCQIFAGNNPAGAPEAIIWAADNGAVIANNSWGYVFESSEAAKKAKIPAELKDAIDYFIKYAGCDENGEQLPDSPMKGGIVLFSAGNNAWDSDPICAYEPVIAVGSIGPDLNRAYYSNFGDWVDIAAPGGNANFSSGQVLSTLPSNKYGDMQGTSMACPHVAGIAALIASYYGGPGFTNEMLKERLLGGARKDVLPNSAKIGPLADALGSMTYGGTVAPDKVADYEVLSLGNKVTVSLNVTVDKDDVKPYEYIVLMTSDSGFLENIDIQSLPEEVSMYRFTTGLVPVGEKMDMDILNLSYEQEYHLCIFARDYTGNISEISEIKTVITGVNNPPVIEPLNEVGDVVLRSHESLTIPFNITDPEGSELNITISPGLSGASIKLTEDGTWNFIITASIANPGKYSGEIRATDTDEQSSAYTINYEVLANSKPVILKEIGNILTYEVGDRYEYDLADYFSDPDGESLSYKVTEENKMVAKASIDGSRLVVEATGYGSTNITVTASDAKKASVQIPVRLVAKDKNNALEIYPVPVETVMYVRTGAPMPTDIKVTSMSGQVVFEENGKEVSAFDPASIDLSECAPGRYAVKVTFDGRTYDRIITKI